MTIHTFNCRVVEYFDKVCDYAVYMSRFDLGCNFHAAMMSLKKRETHQHNFRFHLIHVVLC